MKIFSAHQDQVRSCFSPPDRTHLYPGGIDQVPTMSWNRAHTNKSNLITAWSPEMKCPAIQLKSPDLVITLLNVSGSTNNKRLATRSVFDTLHTKHHWSSRWRSKFFSISRSSMTLSNLKTEHTQHNKKRFQSSSVACQIFFSLLLLLFSTIEVFSLTNALWFRDERWIDIRTFLSSKEKPDPPLKREDQRSSNTLTQSDWTRDPAQCSFSVKINSFFSFSNKNTNASAHSLGTIEDELLLFFINKQTRASNLDVDTTLFDLV